MCGTCKMDMLNGAVSLAEKAGEVYSDYQRGRSVRLGQYGGHENIKKMGHYSAKTGRRLAIYHHM